MTIRNQIKGRKKVLRLRKPNPFFIEFIIVYNDRRGRTGKIIERIGCVNKVKRDFQINQVRFGYWLNRGLVIRKSVFRYLKEFAYGAL